MSAERTIDTARRDGEAAALRAKRWSYDRIATELGYHDRSHARKAVQRAILATVREAGEEARALELEQLDRMAEACWVIIEKIHYAHSQGRVIKLDDVPLLDDGPTLAAIDRLLKIQERRSKLLGLDAPVTIRHLTEDVVDAEIRELEARLAGRASAGEAATSAGSASTS